MGYTHHWRRPQTVPDEIWSAIRRDFGRLLMPLHDQGVELAGGLGTGSPEITDELIRFNVSFQQACMKSAGHNW